MPIFGNMRTTSLERKMDKVCSTLYPAYQAKNYEYVASTGLAIINEFRAYDVNHVPMKSMVETCCPIVSYTGQAYEKLGKPEIAQELYRWIIRRGCIGLLPFTRLAILLERDGDLPGAIVVCDKAMRNKWFGTSTAQGAQREFSKRKARLEKKLEKQRGE